MFDTLRAANWQRQGGKGAKPVPLPRPGEKPDTETLGGAVVMSMEEAREWSAKRRAAEQDDTGKGGD